MYRLINDNCEKAFDKHLCNQRVTVKVLRGLKIANNLKSSLRGRENPTTCNRATVNTYDGVNHRIYAAGKKRATSVERGTREQIGQSSREKRTEEEKERDFREESLCHARPRSDSAWKLFREIAPASETSGTNGRHLPFYAIIMTFRQGRARHAVSRSLALDLATTSPPSSPTDSPDVQSEVAVACELAR